MHETGQPAANGFRGEIAYFSTTTGQAPVRINISFAPTARVIIRVESVQGVSEVANVGGYVRQYQIEIDPDELRFHDIPLERLIAAV